MARMGVYTKKKCSGAYAEFPRVKESGDGKTYFAADEHRF